MSRRSILAIAVLLLMGQAPPAPKGTTISGAVLVVDDKGNALDHPEDVWVYLVPVTASDKDIRQPHNLGKGKSSEIRQHDRRFEPGVIVVQRGTTVWFPNLDTEIHNVFSNDKPSFDLDEYKRDTKGREHVFLDNGAFTIYCNIHQEMSATVKVINTEWYGPVTGGHFTLEHVPPGRYKVVAWRPYSTEVLSTAIDVETDPVTVPELHLLFRSPPPTHLDKLDQTYGPYRRKH